MINRLHIEHAGTEAAVTNLIATLETRSRRLRFGAYIFLSMIIPLVTAGVYVFWFAPQITLSDFQTDLQKRFDSNQAQADSESKEIAKLIDEQNSYVSKSKEIMKQFFAGIEFAKKEPPLSSPYLQIRFDQYRYIKLPDIRPPIRLWQQFPVIIWIKALSLLG